MADTADWRRKLRRRIAWMLILKVGALVLLWALFFSTPVPDRDLARGASIAYDTAQEKNP